MLPGHRTLGLINNFASRATDFGTPVSTFLSTLWYSNARCSPIGFAGSRSTWFSWDNLRRNPIFRELRQTRSRERLVLCDTLHCRWRDWSRLPNCGRGRRVADRPRGISASCVSVGSSAACDWPSSGRNDPRNVAFPCAVGREASSRRRSAWRYSVYVGRGIASNCAAHD